MDITTEMQSPEQFKHFYLYAMETKIYLHNLQHKGRYWTLMERQKWPE